MEQRKQKETEYYDKKAEERLIFNEKKGDFEGFSPFLLESYKFLQKIAKNKIENKTVLDYGCGNGIHSDWLVKLAKKVVAIDLSEQSLKIAKQKAKQVEFLLMDCESLDFLDNSFDVIFDGGTFSSLDLNRAFPEIARVLKPNGCLIGIETLGHNPLTNFKRKVNKIIGKRTKWAESHIFKMKDLKLAEKYFQKTDLYFFHLISWLAFPFLKLPGGKFLLKLFEKLDSLILFIFPFLKRYSFKIVFVFSNPKKYEEII